MKLKRLKEILKEDWTVDAARKKHAPSSNPTSSSANHPYHDTFIQNGFQLKHNGFASVYEKSHTHSQTGVPFVSHVGIAYPHNGDYTSIGITHHYKSGRIGQSGTNYYSKDKLHHELSNFDNSPGTMKHYEEN